MLIGDEHHLDIALPAFHHERPAACGVARYMFYPTSRAILLNKFLVQGIKEWHRDELQEVGGWSHKRHLQSALIDGFNAFQGSGFPAVDVSRSHDRFFEGISNGRFCLGPECSRPGIDVALSSDRRAVGEGNLRLEMEGIDFIAAGSVPARRLLWLDVQVTILTHKATENHVDSE